MKNYRIALALLTASLLWGCKSTSTGPSTNTSTTITKPNVGTTYTSKSTTTDSTSTLTDSSTVVATVVANGLTVAGNTSVYEIIERSLDGTPQDTVFVHYETNGNVSTWTSDYAPDSTGWTTYPFGTQATASGTQDVTLDLGFGPIPMQVTTTLKGLGTGSITVNGKTFSTRKVSWSQTASYQNTPYYSQTTTLEFAPELGWLARVVTPGTRDLIDGSMGDTQSQVLVGYSLK